MFLLWVTIFVLLFFHCACFQLKRLLCHLRQNRKLCDTDNFEYEERKFHITGEREASPESEVLSDEYIEPQFPWEAYPKAGILHFESHEKGSKPGAVDLKELSKTLEEHTLQVITVDDWILIQRASFDILIAEEPYHSIQIYVNLSTNKYVVRVWGISIKTGDSLTTKDLQELCIYCFKKSAACVGYLGFPPREGVKLIRVNFPCSRWISRSCEVAYAKNQGSFSIGLCPACSGETHNRESVKRKEESDQTVETEDRFDDPTNLDGNRHDIDVLQTGHNGAVKKQEPELSLDAPLKKRHATGDVPQNQDSLLKEANLKPAKKQRTKNFSTHDRFLALRLLKDCDPDGILSCLKWRPEVKEKKEEIYATIHNIFRQESDRKSVTLEEVCRHFSVNLLLRWLLYSIICS